MSVLARAAAWAKWAWNPPADAMISDHEFVPLGWMSECGAIPGHPDGDCPTRGRCQHNHCGKPKRYHAPGTSNESEG